MHLKNILHEESLYFDNWWQIKANFAYFQLNIKKKKKNCAFEKCQLQE